MYGSFMLFSFYKLVKKLLHTEFIIHRRDKIMYNILFYDDSYMKFTFLSHPTINPCHDAILFLCKINKVGEGLFSVFPSDIINIILQKLVKLSLNNF